MTLDDFRAWLSGYSEGFVGGVPTREQWERVLDRLGAVKAERGAVRERIGETPPLDTLIPPPKIKQVTWIEEIEAMGGVSPPAPRMSPSV